MAIRKQKIHRFNGYSFDDIYFSANVDDAVGTLSVENGGTGVTTIQELAQEISTEISSGGTGKNMLDNACWFANGKVLNSRNTFVVGPNTPYYSDSACTQQVGTTPLITNASWDGINRPTININGTTYYVQYVAPGNAPTVADRKYMIDRWTHTTAVYAGNPALTGCGFVHYGPYAGLFSVYQNKSGINIDDVFIQAVDQCMWMIYTKAILTMTVVTGTEPNNSTIYTITGKMVDQGNGYAQLVSDDGVYYINFESSVAWQADFIINLNTGIGEFRIYRHRYIASTIGNMLPVRYVKLEVGTKSTATFTNSDGIVVINDGPVNKYAEDYNRAKQSHADINDDYANMYAAYTDDPLGNTFRSTMVKMTNGNSVEDSVNALNTGKANVNHSHTISQISDLGSAAVNYANTAQELRTYNASGQSHGTSWQLKCQHNIYGDGRFGFRAGNGTVPIRCDYATTCDTPNGDTVSNWLTALQNAQATPDGNSIYNWLNYLNGQTGSSLKIKSGYYIGTGTETGNPVYYGLTTCYIFYISTGTSLTDRNSLINSWDVVRGFPFATTDSTAGQLSCTPRESSHSLGVQGSLYPSYFLPTGYQSSNTHTTNTASVRYDWLAIGV